MRGIEIDCIRPGKPEENAHIESFNERLRDECLNTRWFGSREAAGVGLQAWRHAPNDVRRRSQLGDLPPAALAAEISALGRTFWPSEVISGAWRPDQGLEAAQDDGALAIPSGFSEEVNDRSVRLVLEHGSEHRSRFAAMRSVTETIGCSAETQRKWVERAEGAQGMQPCLTTDERERLQGA